MKDKPLIPKYFDNSSSEARVMDCLAFSSTAILIAIESMVNFRLFEYFIIVPFFMFYVFSLVNRNHLESKGYATSIPVVINNVCYLIFQLCTLAFYDSNEKVRWTDEFANDFIYVFFVLPTIYVVYRIIKKDLKSPYENE
jgi:uncharacterized membrane protein YoaK (UPF0700 family)